MEHEIAALKGRLDAIEMQLANIEERSHAGPVNIVLDAPGEPLEVFVRDENLTTLREAIGKLSS